MRTKLSNRRRYELKFISLSAFVLLLFSVAVSAQDDTRISATWQVQKYEITASLPTSDADRNLTARATLSLRNVSSRPASSLTLRISASATVSAVSVNGTTADFTKSEEKVGSASLQRIAIRIPSIAPSANTTAIVDYKLNIKDNSGLAAVSTSGAQFLPLSYWYPTPNSWYFARGADYGGVRVQINAPGLVVVGSGKELSGAFDQPLFVQPFFVAGNFDRSTLNGVEVYLPKGSTLDEKKRAEELAALYSESKSFVSSSFGAGPDTPLRIVAVKRGGGFASGGTLLVDESVFRRSKIDSGTVSAATEAIGKLWFADNIQLSGDGFGVIREGLPRYLSTQFIETKYGKAVADVERMRQRNAYSSVSQRDAPIIQVAPLDDYYFSTVAYKGSMAWRLLSRRVGAEEFSKRIASGASDRVLTLGEIRSFFPEQKELLEVLFDKVTDTNLLVGLPQAGSGETKAALRNTGSVDVNVTVTATFANGEKMSAPTSIRAMSFGEISFRSPNKVVRLEIDTEKLFPQTDYSDDVAPREFTDSDLLLAVKRAFDKQDFALAESTARNVLKEFPNFDDVRVLLGRSLLAQNKNADAEREFRRSLDEKMPTARTLAWAYLGLAEVAQRNGETNAVKLAEEAIKADADFGAGLGARVLRNKVTASGPVSEEVKAYFASFDRAALSNRKAEIDATVIGGEASRFVSGVSGNVVEWKSLPTHVDQLSADTLLVEAQMSVKMLNREVETGMAVYRLIRTGSGWKLYSADVFEVR